MTRGSRFLHRWTSSALICAALGFCGMAAASAQSKTHIADAWYAHNAVLLMLGAANNVVATVARPNAFPWMYRVAPGLSKAEAVDGATMNGEELLRLDTDVVFTTTADPSIDALRRTGLDVVPVNFTDFDSMLACIDLTARTLDTPLAMQRAADYRRYLQQTLADTAKSLGDLSAQQPPRVLHVASIDPLKVDGADTIVDQWIHAAGGRNAADGLRGNLKPVSIEQVLAWQPDIVVLAANAGAIDSSPQRALWNTLDAVRKKHVYRNPAGVFPWDRYGPEVALQVRWAAHMFHPERAQHDDLTALTRQFYAAFFSYALSDSDARRMLAGLPPDRERGSRAP